MTDSASPVASPDPVSELIGIGREFHGRGWSLGTSSNYSVVTSRDPLQLTITGSGFDKGRLTPNDFVVVDAHGNPVTTGGPKPSAETLLHALLARCAGAGAVLHTHSVAATVLSELHASAGWLPISGYEMLKGLAGITTHETRVNIAIVANTQDIAALAAELEPRVSGPSPEIRHGFLMAGHGLYTWGRDLAEARRHIEVLEFLFDVLTRKRQLQ